MTIKNKYASFDEWYEDYEIFQKNPDDHTFMKFLERRTNNSSKELRQEVQHFLQNRALDTNPYEVFGRVMREVGPDYFLIVKTQEDPFFEV